MGTAKSATDGTAIAKMPCLCGNVRRAARALTQLYERELARTGLSATQMTILQVLSRTGEVRQGRLGEMLAMDSTSLTRTLGIMRRSEQGWVAERRGKDRRERWFRLSAAGVRKLRQAEPAWEAAQSKVRMELGQENWNRMMELNQELAEALSSLSA